ncbi:hypothetical protein HYALB_00004240 [Hymenoscyphus albidus]|uniref:Helicase C-terminal domain-containing protein n=1 Tax=Hymenoscyphus albidus TaxID=595503 RepID=A0A9N9Q4T2_9HELO|nr:hypothetical protein HYALB_00004240 [Hymenoscyphus albidus]
MADNGPPSPGSDIFLRQAAALSAEEESDSVAISDTTAEVPKLTASQLNDMPSDDGPERAAWFQATMPGPRLIIPTPFWLGIRATSSEVFLLLAAIRQRLDKEGITEIGKGEDRSTNEAFYQLARRVRAHESFNGLVAKVLAELPFFISGYDNNNEPPLEWRVDWISKLLVETALHSMTPAPERLAEGRMLSFKGYDEEANQSETPPSILALLKSNKDKGTEKTATPGRAQKSARPQVSAGSGRKTTTSAAPKPPPKDKPVKQAPATSSSRRSVGGNTAFKIVQKFKLVVMSEDRTHEVIDDEMYAEDCLAPDGNSYSLRAILREFQKKLDEEWPASYRGPLKLDRGKFGYETGTTRKAFKPIQSQGDLDIAINRLFQTPSEVPDEWTVQFTFYPEDAVEKRNREAREKAKARLAGSKKPAAKPAATSSKGKTPVLYKVEVLPFSDSDIEPSTKIPQRPASLGNKDASLEDSNREKSKAKDAEKDSYKTPTGSTSGQTPVGSIKEPKPGVETETKRGKIKKAMNKMGERLGVKKTTKPTDTTGPAKPGNITKPPVPDRSTKPNVLTKKQPETPGSSKPSSKPPSQAPSRAPEQKIPQAPLKAPLRAEDDTMIPPPTFTIISKKTYIKGGNADLPIPEVPDEDRINIRGGASDESELLEAGSEDSENEAEVNSTISGKEYLANQLQQLVNSEELTHMQNIKDPFADLANWSECCRMFKIDPDNQSNLSLVTVRGLKTRLYPYQIFGTYWQMKNSRAVGGGIVADEMGLGKTLSYLAYITVERQLSLLYLRLEAARSLESKKHHKLGAEDTHLPCRSEGERPEWILCPCSTSNPTYKMKPKPGVRLAIVPSGLVASWMREWDKHINTDLNMRLIVVHPPAFPVSGVPDVRDANNSNPTSKMLASKRSKPTSANEIEDDLPAPEQERILLLASRQYYKEFVESNLEYQPKTNNKNKQAPTPPKNTGIVFGIAMVDEFHEAHWRGPPTKKPLKTKTSILTNLPVTNFPYLWGYSGTPLVASPRGLEPILFAIEHRVRNARVHVEEANSEWKMKPELGLSQFTGENLDAICATYENWIKNDLGYEVMPNLRTLVLPFLKRFVIRRTAESNWFGSPLIRLRPHYHNDIALESNSRYNELFKIHHERYEEPAQKLAIAEAQARFLGIPAEERLQKGLIRPSANSLTFPQYWSIARKERMFATFPYLLHFALAPQGPGGLSFDRNETKRWSLATQYKNSLYCQHLKSIIDTSPKMSWLTEFLRSWKSIKAERFGKYKDVANEKEMDIRTRKLVIVTQFDVVALILHLYLKEYIKDLGPNTRLILSTTDPRQRAKDLEAFNKLEVPGQSRMEREQQTIYPKNFPEIVNIIIGNAQIIGKGLDLTRASNLVLMEPDISFARESQIYSRIHRIGQQAIETQSYRLWCESAGARRYADNLGPFWDPWEWEGQAVERILKRGLAFGIPLNVREEVEETSTTLKPRVTTLKPRVVIDPPVSASSENVGGGSDLFDDHNEEQDDGMDGGSSINVDADTDTNYKRQFSRRSLPESSNQSGIEGDFSNPVRELDVDEEIRRGLVPVEEIPMKKTDTVMPPENESDSENEDSEASVSEISPLSTKREKRLQSKDDEAWPLSSKVTDEPITQSSLDEEPGFNVGSSTSQRKSQQPRFFQGLWGNKRESPDNNLFSAQPRTPSSPIFVEDAKKVDFQRFTSTRPIDSRTGGVYVEQVDEIEHDEKRKRRIPTVGRLRDVKVVGRNRFEAVGSESSSNQQEAEGEDEHYEGDSR